MLRTFLFSLVLLTVAIGNCCAAPARPLYEPPEPPRPPAPRTELHNTAWTGIESADRSIFFHRDGGLSYGPTQKAFGTWKQEGNAIYFEFNNRYREFRGTIQGNIIQGESWNTAGKRWLTNLKPASGPSLPR